MVNNLDVCITRYAFLNARKLYRKVIGVFLASLVMGATYATAQSSDHSFDIEQLQYELARFQKSPELISEIEKVIAGLDRQAPVSTRIDLDLWKLKSLHDVSDTQSTSDFALHIYNTYDRQDYASDEQYGETMQQMVQAFSKTNQLQLALDIIQSLRQSVYEAPSNYLSYIIDKSLMEIYIETFDYPRALETELSILNNPAYQSLNEFVTWRPYLHQEIAFLQNRLGNGEEALYHVEQAERHLDQTSIHPADLLRFRTLNYGNRGRAYLLIGNFSEAGEMGQFVLKSGRELEQRYLTVVGYRLIGSAANNLGNFEKAKVNLEAGIELADKHNIATMQKYLYSDYALTFEHLGQFDKALYWQRKQFELEYAALDTVATARAALQGAESRALAHYEEVKALKQVNKAQQEIAKKDHRINGQLKIIIISLILGSALLIFALYSLRKGQRKLIESEKKAQESANEANVANAAKSDFLANMSHEIRTPMNGVLGMTEILGRTPLNETQKSYVDIISTSGRNLLAIINDILDFSKIEANKLELTPTDSDLKGAVDEVVTLLSPAAKNKGLVVIFDYDPKLPKHFVVDAVRFKQVVSNLVGNAIKFTQEGHVIVRVSGKVSNGHANIKVDVNDTGIGISQDKLALIFEKFTQAEGSTTRQFGGTGLGLAISRRLAAAMNGDLTATSVYGEGSTFSFNLPLRVVSELSLAEKVARTSQLATRPVVKSHPKPVENKPIIRNIKILVAEDDEVNRSVVSSFLRHPRIDVTACENGAKAVELYRVKHFDIILMDVSMPVMDGLVATQEIRKIEAQNSRLATPIICLSAHAMIKDQKRFIQAGMDDYLPKPLQREVLLKAVKKWLQANKTRQAKQTVDRTAKVDLQVSKSAA